MIEYETIRYVRPDKLHYEFNSDDAKNFKERFLSMEEGSTLNLKFERTDRYSPTSRITFHTHHSTDVNGIKTFHISRNVKGGTTSSTNPYIQQYFAENFKDIDTSTNGRNNRKRKAQSDKMNDNPANCKRIRMT